MGSRNNFIRYADGDGHDTVWGITANDTLNILAEQSVTSLIISGNSSGGNGYRIGIYRRKETSSSTTNPANSYGTSTSTTHAANRYFYTGGDLVISTCEADEKIIFATDYTGAIYDGAGVVEIRPRTPVVRTRIILTQLNRTPVIGYRLAHLIQPRLCRPAIVPRQEIIGIKLYRLAEVLRRPLMVALIAILIALAQFQVRQEDFILADNFSGNGFFFRRRLCLQYE